VTPAVAALGFLPTDSFNVVVIGAVFVLISLGLYFTFGLLDVVNLAHGGLILIGAYTALQMEAWTGSVLFGMAAAAITAGLVGVAMERGILRFLYERPLDSLLATFGLAVIIRQVVQLLYSANPRTVPDPIGGSFSFLELNIPWWRLMIVIITALFVVAVLILMERTRFGLRARATVRNPHLAETQGVNIGWYRAAMFAIGASLSGIAGAVLAPINTLNPQFGLLFLVNSFLVVILGGKRSLRGIVVAGLVLGGSLGVLQFIISTVIAQIVVLVLAIAAVRLRPVVERQVGEWRQRRAAAEAA